MTPEQALIGAIVLSTVTNIAVGYWVGSSRTFASLGYGSEPAASIWSTLRPCYGLSWRTFYVAKTPFGSAKRWIVKTFKLPFWQS